MKIFISIFLAIQMLISGILPGCFQEMEKLCDLKAHFNNHCLESCEKLSFAEFLFDHYVEKSHTEKEHEDLPFAGFHCSGIAYIVPDLHITTIPLIYEEGTESSYEYKFTYSFEKQDLLLNPPQALA